MKTVYFVTEGVTDQIILEELVNSWLGGEDFVSNRVQPPSSAIAESRDGPLSEGWRGVLAWCESQLETIALSRAHVLESADLLVVHLDADVGFDSQFKDPPVAAESAVEDLCDHVEGVLSNALGHIPGNVVLCVPSHDLECWIVCALYPDVADREGDMEIRARPAELLLDKQERLVRRKDGRIRKLTANYQQHKATIVEKWGNCAADPARCSRAALFEQRVQVALGLP